MIYKHFYTDLITEILMDDADREAIANKVAEKINQENEKKVAGTINAVVLGTGIAVLPCLIGTVGAIGYYYMFGEDNLRNGALEKLNDPNVSELLRPSALKSAIYHTEEDGEKLKLLLPYVHGKNPRMREVAVELLGGAGGRGIDVLAELVHNQDVKIVRMAAEQLSYIKDVRPAQARKCLKTVRAAIKKMDSEIAKRKDPKEEWPERKEGITLSESKQYLQKIEEHIRKKESGEFKKKFDERMPYLIAKEELERAERKLASQVSKKNPEFSLLKRAPRKFRLSPSQMQVPRKAPPRVARSRC